MFSFSSCITFLAQFSFLEIVIYMIWGGCSLLAFFHCLWGYFTILFFSFKNFVWCYTLILSCCSFLCKIRIGVQLRRLFLTFLSLGFRTLSSFVFMLFSKYMAACPLRCSSSVRICTFSCPCVCIALFGLCSQKLLLSDHPGRKV